jgi:NhaA family Na+:H+ antiporter
MDEARSVCPLTDDRESAPPPDQATEVPAPAAATNRLDRPVDVVLDHLLGPSDAPITLVEYGSYACPYCRAANERITEVRGQLGDRLRYVFRHRPLIGSELARPAAELAECAADHAQFWEAHVTLMTRSATLTEDDLQAVAEQLGLTRLEAGRAGEIRAQARERVEQDVGSARASGVHYTPTLPARESEAKAGSRVAG